MAFLYWLLHQEGGGAPIQVWLGSLPSPHTGGCLYQAFTSFQIMGLLVSPTYLAFYFCLLVFQRGPGSSVSSVCLLVDSSKVILPFEGLYMVAMEVRLG